MEQFELISQFVADLQITERIVQYGTLSSVYGILTPDNLQVVLLDKENQHKDIYFLEGVKESKAGRASDTDITHKNHFFIDFDLRTNNPDISDKEIEEEAFYWTVIFAQNDFLKKWRYIVFTGNGLHVHFFGDPVSISSAEQWKAGMQLFLQEAKKVTDEEPDTSCVNVSRVCRLPGTYNNKNGDHKLVRILYHNPEGTIDIAGIEKLPSWKENKEKNIETSPMINKGSRNSTLTSYAGILRRKGLEKTPLINALKSLNNDLCSPPLAGKEVEDIGASISRYSNAEDSKRKLNIVCAADVEAEEVQWLWSHASVDGGYLAKGKMTLLVGDPGLGKSFLTCALAAAITKGISLPGGQTTQAGNVLFLSSEDGLKDTIKKRLDAQDADATRIDCIDGATNDRGEVVHISFEDDLVELEKHIRSKEYDVVIVDPLNSYMGNAETHNDAKVRTILAPLAALADRTGVALLCVMHMNKSGGGKAIYRVMGSIGYVGIARTVLLFTEHPDDEKKRVLSCAKNNIGELPPSLACEISEGKFLWKGEVDLKANDLLDQTKGNNISALDEGKDWLFDLLYEEGPMAAKEVISQAKEVGISQATLRRAREALGVKPTKTKERWVWTLPKGDQDAQTNLCTPCTPSNE